MRRAREQAILAEVQHRLEARLHVQRLWQPHSLQRLSGSFQPDQDSLDCTRGGTEPGTAGRHLAHRDGPDHPTGTRRCGALPTAVGPRSRSSQGATVINFRSEGRRFANGRCLIPASHFYEFTGAKTPKSKWRFTMAGAAWFCFAGLWRSSEKAGDAFTILTTAPGPDVPPIHNRQIVVLPKADWMAWLDLTRPEAELLKPLPPGSLTVEQVR